MNIDSQERKRLYAELRAIEQAISPDDKLGDILVKKYDQLVDEISQKTGEDFSSLKSENSISNMEVMQEFANVTPLFKTGNSLKRSFPREGIRYLAARLNPETTDGEHPVTMSGQQIVVQNNNTNIQTNISVDQAQAILNRIEKVDKKTTRKDLIAIAKDVSEVLAPIVKAVTEGYTDSITKE